jgi:hypothetical protein
MNRKKIERLSLHILGTGDFCAGSGSCAFPLEPTYFKSFIGGINLSGEIVDFFLVRLKP